MLRARPTNPLSPYTTLFRSRVQAARRAMESIRGFASARWIHCLRAFRRRNAGTLQERRSVHGRGHEDNGSIARSQILVYRSEEHTSELQSRFDLVCRLLLEK